MNLTIERVRNSTGAVMGIVTEAGNPRPVLYAPGYIIVELLKSWQEQTAREEANPPARKRKAR